MNTVLNISEAATIAMHSLALIGSSPERINAAQIAERTGFSRHHVAKVLLLLSKRGYLAADRGPSGGYILKKDPSKITLFEIYELIDGKVTQGNCGIHDGECPFPECVFGHLREQVETEFRDYLSKRTIESIVKKKQTI
jgi:Rrf2 family protein